MDYKQEIHQSIQDAARFVRLTFSGAPAAALWERITIRPVEVGGGRALQAAFQGPRKQVAKNFSPSEAPAQVDEFLAMGFRHVDLQCADMDLHVRFTKKGRALVARGKPSASAAPADLSHDRARQYPLPADEPDNFLEALGIMRHGQVLPSMQDKFRQVNHFLSLLEQTALLRRRQAGPLRIVDAGCGRAFLTLAAFHYLSVRKGLAVELTGVDADADVIRSAQSLRQQARCPDVALEQARILDYQPPEPPHAVLSLHACDTATDEAIARGVQWGAELILAAPCCQHELHHEIKRDEFRAVLRHGILRERTADILTDALRAAALRAMGYRTDVIEFIDPGHTAKNLMIRAEKARNAPLGGAVEEYLRLRDFWQVRPAIETLLGEPLQSALSGPR